MRFVTSGVLLFLGLSASVPALAGEAGLNGHIRGPGGEPIPDVVIEVLEADRQATTDSTGSYSISGLSPGKYTVSAHRTGYAPETRTASIEGETMLDVTLRPTPFEMEPIVVTQSRAAESPENAPLPTSVLSGDNLRRNHTVSLAHAIEQLPGVRALTTGAQVGKPVIRGMTGPRVLVLDDGNRLEDYSWSDEDGPSIDARLAERVEVVRGPASLLYGSDAVGGAVNAISRELPNPREGNRSRFGLEAYAASNNHEFGSAFLAEGAHDPVGWRLFLVGRAAEDLHTPNGPLDNTGFEALNGEAALGTRSDHGSAELRFARYGGEFKLLEAEGPSSEEEGGPERKLSDNRLQFSGKSLIGGIRWDLHAQWQSHSLIELADTPGDTSSAMTETEQFNLLLQTGTLDLIAHFGRGGTAGLSGIAQSSDSRGPIPLIPDAKVRSGGVFVIEQLRHDRWDVMAGLRVDGYHVKADPNPALSFSGDSEEAWAVTGNAGLVYHLDHAWSLAANLGNAWRAPTLLERYANGPRLSEARFEIGRPDLDPERGVTLDGGLRLAADRVRGELTAFTSHYSDFVYLTPTGQFQDSLAVYEYQETRATLFGGEASIEVEVAPPLQLHGRLDYVRGDNSDLDEPLPLIPPLRGFLGGNLRFTSWTWADEVDLSLETELVARQTRLSAFDDPTDGYALLHAGAGLKRKVLNRPFSFDLQVRNLGDVSYRDYMSRYKGFALDQGRNVILRISTGL